MLVIRLQRTGRKGHAVFRIVVQDSRRTPTSGKVVARLGSYDPHTKAIILDKEKAEFYVTHGAQPSERLVYLLKAEGVKLPKWVEKPAKKNKSVKNPEKRRSTAPAEAKSETLAPSEEPDEPASDVAAETVAEAPESIETIEEVPEVAPETEEEKTEEPAETEAASETADEK